MLLPARLDSAAVAFEVAGTAVLVLAVSVARLSAWNVHGWTPRESCCTICPSLCDSATNSDESECTAELVAESASVRDSAPDEDLSTRSAAAAEPMLAAWSDSTDGMRSVGDGSTLGKLSGTDDNVKSDDGDGAGAGSAVRCSMPLIVLISLSSALT